MTQDQPDQDQIPLPEPLPTEEFGHGRRTLGLGLFFLVASISAIVVMWLMLHSPISLDKLFGHYAGPKRSP